MIEIGLAVVVAIAATLAMTAVVLGAVLLRMKRAQEASDNIAKLEHQMQQEQAHKQNGKRRFTLLPTMKAAPRPSVEAVQPLTKQPELPEQNLLESVTMSIKRRMTTCVELEDEENKGAPDYIGRINFGLSYDKDSQTLSVHVLKCQDLPNCDIMGSSDPYVRVWVHPSGRDKVNVTRVHQRTLNPVFNQTLQFTGFSCNRKHDDQFVCLQIMDYDRFSRDDPIGEILLPLRGVSLERCPVFWKNLQKPTAEQAAVGDIMLSLCYQQDKGNLMCTVVKARDLPAKDITGSSDPYVKLWLVENGHKVEKKKTTVKSHQLAPVFNEAFKFQITPERLDQIQLVVTVMDYDIVGSNDEMGHVVLGMRGCESGQKQWNEAVGKPGHPVATWHKLSPKW